MPRIPITAISRALTPRASVSDALTEGRRIPEKVIKGGGGGDALLSQVSGGTRVPINPRAQAGIVQDYMANLDDEAIILEQLLEMERSGEIPKGTLTAIKKGFSDAKHTREVAEQLAGLVDAQYPQRYPGVRVPERHRPQGLGSLFDTRDLDEIPQDMPASYEIQVLPAPSTFDLGDFASRSTPQRIRAARAAIERAPDIDSSISWYNTSPLYSLFKSELGPIEGPKSFMDAMGLVAVSSPESVFPDNMLRGFQLYHFLKSGKPMPNRVQMRDDPTLLSHMYHDSGVMPSVRRLMQGQYPRKTVQGHGGSPKVGSFYQNLIGNYGPGTMDRHMFNAAGQFETTMRPAYGKIPGSDEAVPLFNPDGTPKMHRAIEALDRLYTPLELLYLRMAQQSRLAPAQAQSAIWTATEAGPRKGPRHVASVVKIFEDMVRHSAGIYGEQPVAHLIDIIKGTKYPRRKAEGGLVEAAPSYEEPRNLPGSVTYFQRMPPPSPQASVGGLEFLRRLLPRRVRPKEVPVLGIGVRG